MALNNDFPADAYLITIGSSGQYISGPNDLSNFTKTSDEPLSTETWPGKTSWYRYRPATSGTMTVYASGVNPSDYSANLPVDIYGFGATNRGLVDASQALGGNNNYADASAATSWSSPVTGGTLYFLRVSPAHDDPTVTYLKVLGPATTAPDADLIATAPIVDIASSGTWLSPPVPDEQLTVTSEEPIPSGSARSAWWQLEANGNQNYVVTGMVFDAASDPPNANLVMQIWYDNYGPLVLSDTKAVGQSSNVTLNGGSRHVYITIYNTVQSDPQWTYRLNVTGGATVGPPAPDLTNHQYVNAITIPSGTSWSATLDTNPTYFGSTETLPPGLTGVGNYRAGWYSFTPTTSGAYIFNASGYSAEIDIIRQSDVVVVNSTVYNTLRQQLVAGIAYWVRFATANYGGAEVFTLSMSLDVDTTNHQYANAVALPSSGSYTITLDTTDSHYNLNEDTPPGSGGGFRYQRSGWYTFTPAVSAHYRVVLTNSSTNISADLFRVSDWSAMDYDFGSTQASISVDLVAGTLYALRTAANSSNPSTTTLVGTSNIPASQLPMPPITITTGLAATAVQPMLQAVAIQTVVRVQGHISGEFAAADATPIAVHVLLPPASDVIDDNAAPPIAVSVAVSGQLIDTALYLTQPVDGEVIVTDTPQFIVALQQHDDDIVYTIEIQYDESSDFSSPVTLSGDTDSTGGGLVADATTALTGSTGYWRARLLLDGQELITWTPYNTFTIDATVTAQSLPVTWTVSTGAARPIHLWHLDPPGPHVGDLVTAYGQGFATIGNLTIADQPQAFESWDLIAASAAMASEGRVIDADVVDPEHYEVTFYAPDLGDEPGGALVVEA